MIDTINGRSDKPENFKTLQENGMGMVDYAAQILEQEMEDIKSGKKKITTTPAGAIETSEVGLQDDMVELPDTDIPTDFIAAICEQGDWDGANPVAPKVKKRVVKTPKKVVEPKINEEVESPIEDRLERIERVLEGLIKVVETTTVGALGVNMGGPGKDADACIPDYKGYGKKKKKTKKKQKEDFTEQMQNRIRSKVANRSSRLNKVVQQLSS